MKIWNLIIPKQPNGETENMLQVGNPILPKQPND